MEHKFDEVPMRIDGQPWFTVSGSADLEMDHGRMFMSGAYVRVDDDADNSPTIYVNYLTTDPLGKSIYDQLAALMEANDDLVVKYCEMHELA